VSSPRALALAALALALWTLPRAIAAAEPPRGDSITPLPVRSPTENAVSNIVVESTPDGDWLLDFDYAYTGQPPALLRVELVAKPGMASNTFNGIQLRTGLLVPGALRIKTVLQYPGESTTSQVVVSIVRNEPNYPVLTSAHLDKVIQWPSQDQRDFRLAVNLIDNGTNEALREARQILERLIGKDSKFAPGYIELARVAMKTNWGPEGLHQAETLLDSALKIDALSVNAKILLGYVYTHQERYREAESLFVDAARSNPINTWLWANWGEMLEKQGKEEQAIARYREALARPVQSSEYNAARNDAYVQLARLLIERNDLDGTESLYKARIAEFGPGSCYSNEYAKFKLYVRGDAPGAIELARGALEQDCDDAPSREILGLASYVQWAQRTDPGSADALNQARIFLPTSPRAIYLLADNERTMVAVKKLIVNGEAIDQKDNEKMTALGHALENGKPQTAERLLRAGAKPETPVGYMDMPVALLPVMNRDLGAIRVLQRAGVDYSKLRFRGSTAIDYAKQMGDDELLGVLKHKERAL
jgi:tetratricopeptide (TPR) repeat protein